MIHISLSNFKEVAMQLIKDHYLIQQINGGCFCYCFTNPYNILMTTLFVQETATDEECNTVCTQDKTFPFYGYAECIDELYCLLGYPDDISYPQHVIDTFNYLNGGWKVNYPHLSSN